jgi:hypothetical protein
MNRIHWMIEDQGKQKCDGHSEKRGTATLADLWSCALRFSTMSSTYEITVQTSPPNERSKTGRRLTTTRAILNHRLFQEVMQSLLSIMQNRLRCWSIPKRHRRDRSLHDSRHCVDMIRQPNLRNWISTFRVSGGGKR